MPGGGTDLERGYGDVRPWRPPFQASPAARKGPISRKSQFTRPPFEKNLEILASTASIFTQILAHKPPNLEIFSLQAPKFGNFQLTSPQMWKFSAHKPPFQRQMSVRKLHTSEIRAAHPYLKKSWVPPPRVHAAQYALLMCLLLAAPTSTHGVFTSFSLSQYTAAWIGSACIFEKKKKKGPCWCKDS